MLTLPYEVSLWRLWLCDFKLQKWNSPAVKTMLRAGDFGLLTQGIYCWLRHFWKSTCPICYSIVRGKRETHRFHLRNNSATSLKREKGGQNRTVWFVIHRGQQLNKVSLFNFTSYLQVQMSMSEREELPGKWLLGNKARISLLMPQPKGWSFQSLEYVYS